MINIKRIIIRLLDHAVNITPDDMKISMKVSNRLLISHLAIWFDANKLLGVAAKRRIFNQSLILYFLWPHRQATIITFKKRHSFTL
jgi:hypothetical protein